MTKLIRRQRRAVETIKKIPTIRVFEWLGPKSFKRVIAHEKFDTLRNIFNSPREFQDFCSAIGWVEVNWALIEAQFDRWCQVAFITFRFRGKDGKTNEIPRQYSRKVRYLREAFSKVSALKKYANAAVPLLDKADKLSETRHDLTHGMVTHLEAKNGRYFLENWKIQKDGRHIIKNIEFDVRLFPSLGKELQGLVGDAIRLTHLLADTFLDS